MKAPINKIIDFSTVDGEGNRSVIFFQGCNIHCLYCHNPETQPLIRNEDEYIKYKETHDDVTSLEFLTPEEVFKRIEKNIPFIRGITVSGGECSLYPCFITELFNIAKKYNLTTLLDSNGMVKYSSLPDLMEVTDGVMLDIKSWDEDLYFKLVGSSNKIVKENLKWLSDNNKIEELRIVYVPDYVDAKRCLEGIKEILGDKIETIKLKLIAFRHNGVTSILKEHRSPTNEEMLDLKNFALNIGYKNIILK